MEIDLEYIKKMGKEKEDENWNFRTFIKQYDMPREEMDALVHEITERVSAEIDCTQCGNCCVHMGPVLDEDDISRFALGLNIPVSEFQAEQLTETNDYSSGFKFNVLPCPFLENKQCTNYDHRPKNCQSYPHLHKEGFTTRLWGVVDNYEICPIVFHVYEEVKARLWHRMRYGEDEFEWGWS